MKAQIYYREFDDLTDLNEWVELAIKEEDVISVSYVNGKHCLYYWQKRG